jgi:hypothetical protein
MKAKLIISTVQLVKIRVADCSKRRANWHAFLAVCSCRGIAIATIAFFKIRSIF